MGHNRMPIFNKNANDGIKMNHIQIWEGLE